ncbi:hypothetical protein BS50DRAFT_570861 [Corynespora cassiicola Philippines]|uniref:Rhodopsin domain-containing protein n=1 Tax=Corynespora cassiicola Philippines TaxID=1448308 RepID=A0A2T2P1H0_CORCC|nr:hypothetical protein BS50DRAFT_570861 [Corynespora cassiicola Philippines]
MATLGDSSLTDGLTAEVLVALKDFPLAFPPEGITADFENRQFYGYQILITGCVLLFILTMFLVVRTYAKLVIFKQTTIDDYIYWISWPAGAIYIIVAIVVMGSPGGIFGYHAWDVRLGEVTVRSMMNARTLSILYGPLQWLQKLTLFSMLLNIFAPVRWLKPAVYAGAVISGLVYISNSIVSGVYCGPRGGSDLVAYLKGLGSPECAGNGIVMQHGIGTGAMTVLLDFYILCLPLPSIGNLRISRKKKIGVFMVFLAGLGACVCGILTLWYRIKYSKTRDPTYTLVPITTVCILEIAVGLMIPCTAPFVRIYRHYSDKEVKGEQTRTPESRSFNESDNSSKKLVSQDSML